MKPVAGINQLSGDPESIAQPLYAALKNRIDVEPPTDLAGINIGAPEGERRGAGDDEEGLDLCQCIDQFFRESLAKILVLSVSADVVKRQNRNGWRSAS